MSSKGPPFILFIFCKRMDVQKLPKALLQFSALCDLLETKQNSKKIFEKKFRKKNFKKKFGIFFSIFSHAGTVEENT